MDPAKRQLHRVVGTIASQALEPVIAIDLQQTTELREVFGRANATAILGIDIGRSKMRWTAPGSIINGVAPKPTRLGAAAAGIEHRQRRVVSKNLGDKRTVPIIKSYNGANHQHAVPTQLHSVERSSTTPWRASICDRRYSRGKSQYLLISTWMISASVGMPPSIGRAGASATTTASSQLRQA
jgi:hypothetical protein